jgi:drug/metabolite transporter (DMT)-like permease
LSDVAIVLILLSALIHATWNLISKRSSPWPAFFLVANALGTVMFSPWVILYTGVLHRIPGTVWAMLVITGFFQALYCTALAASYRHGDLSVSYPVARSLPVILVPAVTVLLGRGGLLGLRFASGAALVLGGTVLVSLKDLLPFRRRLITGGAFPMALCAAIGISGYSMIDDRALAIIRGSMSGIYGTVPVTLVYAFLETISCIAWLGAFILLGGRRFRGGRVPLGWAAGAGILMYITYGLVLVSMAYARDISLIVAFRQISILAGAFMGIVFLRESAGVVKIAGLTVLFAGLVLVAVS